MTEYTEFPNAPITEALLDIRVKLPPQVDLEQLATFQNDIKDDFPSRRERFMWESRFEIKEGDVQVSSPTGGVEGYLFRSSDGKRVVQARLNGFTFNRLWPYENWQKLRDEAKPLWQRYIRIASPEIITRIALRYINRIEIPLPIRDFKDYILTTVEIAPGIPQEMSGFFMRLVIPVPDMSAVAIVTQTFAPKKINNDILPLIFDIDVVRETVFDVEAEEVWDTFDTLRDLKNDIFFKSITEKTKELFQ
jgi:uncharacterized protein (TIGR04255 family)